MTYKYATQRENYASLAPGVLLSGQPGRPAFPVRLASEIYQTCAVILSEHGHLPPYHIYDPVCGGAYHLAVLGLLHPSALRAISASDADPIALELATRNLSMLTREGRQRRREQLQGLYNLFLKDSHRQALRQLDELEASLPADVPLPDIRTFQANALTEPVELRLPSPPDLVISDVPYGSQSEWIDVREGSDPPITRMLTVLLPQLALWSVVAIAADKAQKVAHPAYRQARKIKVGRRQVVVLVLADTEERN